MPTPTFLRQSEIPLLRHDTLLNFHTLLHSFTTGDATYSGRSDPEGMAKGDKQDWSSGISEGIDESTQGERL